jgi:hypothetical protein
MDNCWEVTKCGRETECPAYPLHGRACFAVTATMCRGKRQGSYEAKIEKCRQECAFYKKMMDGDGTEDLWSKTE